MYQLRTNGLKAVKPRTGTRFGGGMGFAISAHLPVEPTRVVTTAADALFGLNAPGRWAVSDPSSDERDLRVVSWSQFHAVTAGRALLHRLGDYSDALLVAGCDRPAATAMTRLFKRVAPFIGSTSGPDDELDGALLLAGLREPQNRSRHCFQTNYLGPRYSEYFAHADFRLIWIVREPRAAVFSMLNERQRSRPRHADLTLADRRSVSTGASRLEQACAMYVATIEQTLELKQRLGRRIAIVDYDDLVIDRTRLLPALCRFTAVDYDKQLLGHLHGKSARRGLLTSWEAAIVDNLTRPAYHRALAASQIF